MKFQMISKCGEGAHLLWLLYLEGNDVSLWIKEPGYQSVFAGLINHKSFEYSTDTVYIFDSSGMGILADKLRKYGCSVFGASTFHDKLENDRQFGLDMMKKAGIKYPTTQEFTDWGKAKDYIKNHSGSLVFKPCGDVPTKLTYVSSSAEDLLLYMDYVESFYGKKIDSFVLQDKIDGALVSSEAWFDGQKMIGPFNQTVEAKKLMNDDLGPSCGCSGNSVWVSEETKIIQEGIKKIEKLAIENEYIGPLDLNAICNNSGVFGLEWTPRFGLDAFPTWLQLYSGELGKLFSDFSRGQGPKEIQLEEGVASGVRLSIPPYPIEHLSGKISHLNKVVETKGLPIRGIPNRYKENIYFYEVMRGEDGLVHSDGTGAIFVASDLGDSVDSSLALPMKICEEAQIPDKQYRTDLPKVLGEMKDKVCHS